MDELPVSEPGRGINPGRYALRALWVATQLVLVYYFGRQGAIFFYQNF